MENQPMTGEHDGVHGRRHKMERGASRAAHRAREKGEMAAGKARQQISSMLGDQKSRAVEELDHLGSVLESTSNNLRSEDEARIARMMDGAVRQIEKAAEYLDEHSVNDLFEEVERFARREPAIFLGGAVLLGAFSARFFRASGRHDRYEGWDGMESGSWGDTQRRAWERNDDRNLRDLEGYDTVHGTAGAEMPDPQRSRTNDVTGAGFSEPQRSNPDEPGEAW